MTVAALVVLVAAAFYLGVALAILLVLMSWEHMGRSGPGAMLRKRRGDWIAVARIAMMWLPLLVVWLRDGRRG